MRVSVMNFWSMDGVTTLTLNRPMKLDAKSLASGFHVIFHVIESG